MNLTLAAIVALTLAVIAGLWAFGRRERKAGEDAVRTDVAVKTVAVQKEQQEAAVNAPVGKPAIIDRLRNGGGL